MEEHDLYQHLRNGLVDGILDSADESEKTLDQYGYGTADIHSGSWFLIARDCLLFLKKYRSLLHGLDADTVQEIGRDLWLGRNGRPTESGSARPELALAYASFRPCRAEVRAWVIHLVEEPSPDSITTSEQTNEGSP